MIFQTLKVAIATALLVCVSSVSMGQDCGCGHYSASDYGFADQDNCGRNMTHDEAMGLWAGYCNESCAFQGGCGGGCGSKLCGRLRNRRNAGSFGGGCGTANCDLGCFGYPTGGCGCAAASRSGCRLKSLRGGGCGGGCKLKSLFSGGGGCLAGNSCGGGGCGGKLKGLFSGSGCGCKLFNRSRNECGCSGAYFDEAVGYEYGNAGIQSCVSGIVDSMPAMHEPCCGQPMAAQPVYGAPIMMPSHQGAPVGTGAPSHIEGDVVEALETNSSAAVMDAATDAAKN